MLSVLTIPAFAGALVLTLVVQLAGTALLPVIPLFVQELLHSSREVATDTGWVMAASGLAAALGSYSAGRLHRHLGLKPVLMTAVVLSAALLVPQALVRSFMAFLLYCATVAMPAALRTLRRSRRGVVRLLIERQ